MGEWVAKEPKSWLRNISMVPRVFQSLVFLRVYALGSFVLLHFLQDSLPTLSHKRSLLIFMRNLGLLWLFTLNIFREKSPKFFLNCLLFIRLRLSQDSSAVRNGKFSSWRLWWDLQRMLGHAHFVNMHFLPHLQSFVCKWNFTTFIVRV